MAPIYYLLVFFSWIATYKMIRESYQAIKQYGETRGIPLRKTRYAQALAVFGLMIAGTSTTYALNMVYSIHLLVMSGAH
ncbi:hypothetical protein BHS87_25810 [Escherichia coli]|nr:hypothetical protein BHS87_25810 [Escherichia coli]